MKSIYYTSLKVMTILLCIGLLTYSSCKGPEPVVEPTPVEVTTALLKGAAWTTQGVKVDDVVLDLL